MRFVDIGANVMDERYTQGSYHGKVRHEPDLELVLDRAGQAGVRHMIVTAGTLVDSREAVQKVREWRDTSTRPCRLYCTVGVHPTRCLEFEENGSDAVSSERHLEQLVEVALDGKRDGTVVAVGEMGLDYDRLQFCPKDVQRKHFQTQLRLAEATRLPMFLHNRNVGTELYDLLVQHQDLWQDCNGGVVHSFDDTYELASKFIDLGLYIGLNGCSLREAKNLEVVKQLPLDRILLETDCPYCGIKRTHAGYSHVQTEIEAKQEKKYVAGLQVKGRNEPCNIVQVAEVVAGVRGMKVEELAEACYQNSLRLYQWED